MGVKGLQTFMEKNCPHGADFIDIKHIIETHRKENDTEIVIAVDGASCLRPIYGDLDWLCGGQIKEYAERFENFINVFKQLGVKLVFFYDGPTQPCKRKQWIARRYTSLRHVFAIYDQLNEGVRPLGISSELMQIPLGSMYITSQIAKNMGCEVHRTVGECDQEVAQYASDNKCFAILAQDSDYVIYDGPQYYLSLAHLNLQTMVTRNYNRYALARHLHLNTKLLPLLATLVGNDIVPFEKLHKFHERICPYRTKHLTLKEIIENVAEFLRNVTDQRHLFRDLPSIARKVFKSEENIYMLEESIQSYSVKTCTSSETSSDISTNSNDENWNNILNSAKYLFKNARLDAMIYAVMHGLPYESSTGTEDFRYKDIPPSALVYQKLRQRIYGIVLFEKPGEKNCVVEEWIMHGENSLSKPVCVEALYPPEDPGLMSLWKDSSPALADKKWRLFAWAISEKLDPNKIKSVAPTLLAPTSILFYLLHETPRFLHGWEVDVFIATMITVPTLDSATLSALPVENIIPRALHLTCVFIRAFSIIKMLLDACGHCVPEPQVALKHFFDGKLFQTLYRLAQSGCAASDLVNDEGKLDELKIIQSLVLADES